MNKQIQGSSRFKGYEKPKVQERFDFAELVRRQIERCLMAAGDPDFMFPNTVQALEALIPVELKDDTYLEEFEKSTVTKEDFKYIWDCGVKIGSEDNPVLLEDHIPVKRDDDGSIDWDDPNIMSPHKVEVEITDWFSRFEAAFNMFCRMGIAVRRTPRG